MFGAGKKQPHPRLPPGPWQLPVIGSLHHLLRGIPHRTMRDLSLRHGPLMLLQVCERVVIVVSSAEAAREIYKGHDAAFSERPSSPGIDELSRHGQGIIFAPYSDHWRLLRPILMTELLSARRVEAFRGIREDEAARLVSSLQASSTLPDGRLVNVNVNERLAEFMADSAVRAIFGDRLPDRVAFLKMVKQGVDLSSLFDLRDLFPSSRLVQLLPRSGSKAERHRREMFRLMDDILKTHEERRAAGEGDDEQDMIDVLLRIKKEGAMRVSLTPGVIRTVLIVRKLSVSATWSFPVGYTSPHARSAVAVIGCVKRKEQVWMHFSALFLDLLITGRQIFQKKVRFLTMGSSQFALRQQRLMF